MKAHNNNIQSYAEFCTTRIFNLLAWHQTGVFPFSFLLLLLHFLFFFFFHFSCVHVFELFLRVKQMFELKWKVEIVIFVAQPNCTKKNKIEEWDKKRKKRKIKQPIFLRNNSVLPRFDLIEQVEPSRLLIERLGIRLDRLNAFLGQDWEWFSYIYVACNWFKCKFPLHNHQFWCVKTIWFQKTLNIQNIILSNK